MATPGFDSILAGPEFINRLQEGLWVADERGVIVFANRALAAILGADDPEQLKGRPWREFFPEAETTRFVKAAPQGSDVSLVPDSTILNLAKDPLPASVALTRRVNNGITWYIGSVVRIHRPGGAVGISEATSRQVMENSVDGICIIQDSRIAYVNHRFEELTGYNANQLRGSSLERLVVPKDRKSVAQVIGEPKKVLMPIHHRILLMTRSGHELDCELRIVPTESNDHTILLCFLRDLSQLRRAERARTDFIATVSHELRTPLAAIKESVSLVSDTAAGQLAERERRYLDIAQEEISRLNRMITNLLEVSRMESGKMTLNLEAVRIEDLIDKTVQSLSLFINKKKLTIERHYPPELPAVLGDRDRLLQVLSNLLDNAIKYTPTGSAIRISSQFVDPAARVLSEPGVLPNTGYIEVTVADSGPGIPAEFLERVFGKFERVDPQGAGIGLGLANVRSIVEMHYGRVWARSDLGEGTSFSFILPIKENV